MGKLEFRDGYIYLDGEYIGLYDWKDENSDFLPTKEKLWWASIFEHEYQSDDYKWWAKSVTGLRNRVKKYLENREKGIKDLPQISDQLKNMCLFVHNWAKEKFENYYSRESGEFIREKLERIGYLREFKKRGYWVYDGFKIIPREIYDLL